MDKHVPVLLEESIAFLKPKNHGRYIDGTMGAGGHTRAILKASAPDGQILAFDRDLEALNFARRRLGDSANRVTAVQDTYARMSDVAVGLGFVPVDGIMLDLGLSSRQLEDARRGFSYRLDGPLDMRFDTTGGPTAADLINDVSEQELVEIFWKYGEINRSRHMAKIIVKNRPINTTGKLAEVIRSAVGKTNARGRRKHPIARLFQAIRIAVNDELKMLDRGLEAAVNLLCPGGRIAVISFHSLEDRITKRFFRYQSRDCICPPEQPICTCDKVPTLKILTRKVIKPTDKEVVENPRSRSARLRVAEKIAGD